MTKSRSLSLVNGIRRQAATPPPGDAAEHFAATIAHDLETSLLVISNSARQLGDGEPELSSEQVEHLQRILRAAERMRRLTASVRSFALAGAHLELERVTLGEVVGEASEALAPLIEQREAMIELGEPGLMLSADRSQMVQLLQNLISNAIKFGPQTGGIVRISTRRTQGAWQIAISDEGPGISEEDRERVFEPRYRLRRTSHEPGYGLGLAICRRIAENHSGSLALESAETGGATFVFTLPDRRPEQVTGAEQSGVGREAKPGSEGNRLFA